MANSRAQRHRLTNGIMKKIFDVAPLLEAPGDKYSVISVV